LVPIVKYRRKNRARNRAAAPIQYNKELNMNPGDALKTVKPIRSQKTGVILPREGTFVRAVENMGRQLILVNFGTAGEEYLFPEEILAEQAVS
jgi:hypothetical protein